MNRALALVAALVGCGRIDFDLQSAAAGDGGPHAAVAYVRPFAQRHPGAGASDSFMVQAVEAGNLVVLQVGCSSTAPPTGVAILAANWNFMPLGSLLASDTLTAATFVAVAPDTAPVTMTVTWDVACTAGKSELGDEFAHAASDNSDLHGGIDNGTGSVPTTSANDAIWAACVTSSAVSALGAGYTKGADDGGGDVAEYKLTTDPAGTLEVADFTDVGLYVVSTVSLRPQ